MPRMAFSKSPSLLLLYTYLAGCTVGPNFIPPEAPDVETYTEAPQPINIRSAPVKGASSQHIISGVEVPFAWWALFGSLPLNHLVSRGVENNPSLQAAQAALRGAEANFRALVGTTLFPTIDGQAFAQRQRFSAATFGVSSGQSNVFNLFNTQVNVSYTLDVFGGGRRALEALCAQVNYQRFIVEATYLTLIGNIVSTAITEASLNEQLKATQEVITLEEKLLKIVEKQFALGAVPRSDVLTQKAQLMQSEALLPPLEKNLSITRHALAVLIGCLPSEPVPSLTLNDLILPPELPISVPSRLVENRPDVRASQELLHAASAQIGVATANLLPNFTLTGYYGWEALKLSDLFKPSSNIWSIMAQVTQPIFHGGALIAKRRAAIEAYEQALAQYQQTVLQAFQNVADALRALEKDAVALNRLAKNEIATKDLLNLSQKQYHLGAVNFLVVLNAERQYQQALLNRIKAQAARLTDTAALFQALGGSSCQCPIVAIKDLS